MREFLGIPVRSEGSEACSNHCKFQAFSSVLAGIGAADPPLGVNVAAGAASTFGGPPEIAVTDDPVADEMENGGEAWFAVVSNSIPSIPLDIVGKGIESGMSDEGPGMLKSLPSVSAALG